MIAERRARAPVVLPRPSTLDMLDDVPDLIRDPSSHVVISAGGRDQGPSIRRGPNGGKRQVHDNLETADVQYEDDKHQHRVSRKVDVLRDMHRREVITDAMLADGIRFQTDFDCAHYESTSCMRYDGLPASGRVASDGGRTDAVVAARTAVREAVKAMGGLGSMGAVALVSVVGERKSFREMSRDNGEHLSMWKGATLTALSVLALHYESLGYKHGKNTR